MGLFVLPIAQHAIPVNIPLSLGVVIDLPTKGALDTMTVDARYRRIFAARSGAKTLCVVDMATGKVRELPVGPVSGIQIDERLGRVFIAGKGAKLIALDRRTLAKIGEVSLPGPAGRIALDSRRSRVYIAHSDGREDWILDGRTLAMWGRVGLAGAPVDAEYDIVSDRVYQNIQDGNELQVIDGGTSVPIALWSTLPMESPQGLSVDPAYKRVFSAGRNGKLVVFGMRDGTQMSSIDIEPDTGQIAYDPMTHRIYCAGHGFITVVWERTVGIRVMGRIPVPAGARTLALDPNTHDVWVGYSDAKGGHLMQLRSPPELRNDRRLDR